MVHYYSEHNLCQRWSQQFWDAKEILLLRLKNWFRAHDNPSYAEISGLPDFPYLLFRTNIDLIHDFFKSFHSIYGVQKIDDIKDELSLKHPDNRKILNIINYLIDEVERIQNVCVLRKHQQRDQNYKAVLLTRDSDGIYWTRQCYFRNPCNIIQIKRAPLHKIFTMHIYDALNIVSGNMTRYNPIK